MPLTSLPNGQRTIFRSGQGIGSLSFFTWLTQTMPLISPIQPPKEYLERVLERETGLSEKRAKNVAFIEHLDALCGSGDAGPERIRT